MSHFSPLKHEFHLNVQTHCPYCTGNSIRFLCKDKLILLRETITTNFESYTNRINMMCGKNLHSFANAQVRGTDVYI